MPNVFIEQNIKNQDLKINLIKEEKHELISLMDNSFSLNEYENIIDILKNREKKILNNEFLLNYIKSKIITNISDIKSKNSINLFIEYFLDIKFSKDYENYINLKFLSELFLFNKNFIENNKLILKYYKILLNFVKDPLIFLNILNFIKTEEIQENKEIKFFLEKLNDLIKLSESELLLKNNNYKSLLFNIKILNIDKLNLEKISFLLDKYYELPNYKYWKAIIKSKSIDFDLSVLSFLKNSNFSYETEKNKIKIKNYSYLGFSSKVFSIIRKFTKNKEKEIKEIKTEEKELKEEKKEEKKIKKVKLDKLVFPKRFSKKYKIQKLIQKNYKANKEDTFFETRKIRYENSINSKFLLNEENKKILKENENTIEELYKKINEQIEIELQEKLKLEEKKEMENKMHKNWPGKNEIYRNKFESSSSLNSFMNKYNRLSPEDIKEMFSKKQLSKKPNTFAKSSENINSQFKKKDEGFYALYNKSIESFKKMDMKREEPKKVNNKSAEDIKNMFKRDFLKRTSKK